MIARPLIWFLGVFVLAAGCSSQPKTPPSFQQRVAKAHGYTWWKGKRDSLAADIHLTFFGDTPDQNRFFDARFTYECATGKTRMRLADDTLIVDDGQKIWVSPASSKVQKARFLARAWPFFVAAPQRLHEQGLIVTEMEPRPFAGQQCPTARITFAPGADHTPDDWCIAYADPKSHRLLAMVYALRAGKGVEGFSDDALAVTFYGAQQIENVVFSTEWRIWKWHRDYGIYGKPIAQARVYNIEFVYPKKNDFTRPADAREATE